MTAGRGPLLVAAVASNGIIGAGEAMPWRLPLELRHFASATRGRAVVIGARTWAGLPERDGGRLPGRTCHVVASRPGILEGAGGHGSGAFEHRDLEAALAAAGPEAAIVGGASIYAEAFAKGLWREAAITRIAASPAGDVLFPEPDAGAWRLVSTGATTTEAGTAWFVETYVPR